MQEGQIMKKKTYNWKINLNKIVEWEIWYKEDLPNMHKMSMIQIKSQRSIKAC